MTDPVTLTVVSESAESTVEPSTRKLKVGEQLASARAKQDMSVDQVASQLKWSARQISEIESGNYAVFPDMLSVRGFVRTYAKFLKIDPVPLMEELQGEFERLPVKPVDRPQLDTPFHSGRLPWINKQSDKSHYVLYAGFLLALFVLAVFVYRAELLHAANEIYPMSTASPESGADGSAGNSALQADDHRNALAGPVAESTPENRTGNDTAAQPEIKSENRSESRAVLPVAQGPSGDKVLLVPPGSPVKSAATPKTPATDPTATDLPSSRVDPANALTFSFKQDSWLQIKRLNGTLVVSKLYRAGTEESINVNEPMTMVIGNAPGVVATLRGQHLDLPVEAGNNVVNVSIK